MFLNRMHVPSLIEKKRDGGQLSADEISYIIANFTRGEIPDYQVSALAMAIFFRGMTDAETWDLTKAMQNGDSPEKMDDFWEFLPTKPRVREFAQPLIDGMNAHLEEIDERIRRYAENYEFRRIATVDRNVLRLAIYEMLYRDDIPPVVSINEAIELAKKFGGAESGRFVNGILDQVRKELTRSAREAVKH